MVEVLRDAALVVIVAAIVLVGLFIFADFPHAAETTIGIPLALSAGCLTCAYVIHEIRRGKLGKGASSK